MSDLYSPVNTMWIGRRLGPVERACLKSFLRAGHPVRLFLYDRIDNVPPGVEIRDAKEVLPQTAIFTHGKSGSVALFSDYFRYKLLALDAGYWVDTDVYCIRPLEFAETPVLGWQDGELCNGAVLGLDRESALLKALLSIFEECRLPGWMPLRERLGFVLDLRHSIRFSWRSRVLLATRRGFSRPLLIGDLPWGAAGPIAITHYVRALGLSVRVQPHDVFYPARWQDAAWIYDPARSLESIATPRTRAVHLWTHALIQHKNRPVPPGSFLERLCQEGEE